MAKVNAVKNNQIQEVNDNDVDVELPSFTNLVGTNANVVPLMNNAQSARLFYASRFVEQAMPLATRETPLVQSLDPDDPDGKSFEEKFGARMGAKYANEDGEVIAVDPDEITLRTKQGDKKIDLYNNFQFNRKTQLSNKPLVKPGDKVKKGQIIAGSNFTDDNGTLSMGINARVAMVPYLGFSMDDAIVVSESFAKKMASEHSYEHDLEKDDNTKFGKAHYHSLFPSKFTKEQLEKLDENGVAKPGVVLQKGDPIILATRPKPVYSNATHLGKLGKAFRSIRADAAETWEHDYPGTVADVVDGKKAHKVFVNAVSPLVTGDKMVMRNGQKCYSADTEIFTDRGWVKFPELLDTDKVAALFDHNTGKTAKEFGVARSECIPQDFYATFVSPIAYAVSDFEGELFGFESKEVSYLVTGNHRMWRKVCGAKGGFRFATADKVHNKQQTLFMNAAPFILPALDPETKEIPFIDAGTGKEGNAEHAYNITKFPYLDFVRFMALYLCEGNCNAKETDHAIIITQKECPFCREIEALFDRLGLQWSKFDNQYRIQSNKSLATYLHTLGHAHDKFIPEWIFNSSLIAIQEFVTWAFQGAGDKEKQSKFYSCNPKLIEGMCRMFTLLGIQFTVNYQSRRPDQNCDNYTILIHKNGGKQLGAKTGKQSGFFKQSYTGKVYCVQVPGLGVVLTRRNGKQVWCGNSIVSKILPDEQMLRSMDGTPFEVLLNPLALPSRVNTATLYELALGKIAQKEGAPVKVPGFTKKGESRLNYVLDRLKKAGLSDTEEVFDPVINRKLEKPVTTGIGYIEKLHHVVDAKISARGQGSYDQNEQPLKGGSDAAQAKRLGGLETSALLAKGGYATLREGSTLRGAKNDDYWRLLRQGYKPSEPGTPFVYDKFKVLLNGAGLNAKDLGKGQLRLGPMTDKVLEEMNPIEIKNGKLVDTATLEGIANGLFDEKLVALNKWGKIKISHPMPNPAFEKQICQMLGVTVADLRRVMAGEVELEEVQKK